VLGSIPVLGRLFRSDGESTHKRNLLIFVTANLVNPGGGLKNQASAGIPAGSLYENPTRSTPSGASARQE
jgi:general secretion pathway protein D